MAMVIDIADAVAAELNAAPAGTFEPAIADGHLEIGIAGKPARGKTVRILLPVVDCQLPPFLVAIT